MENPAQGTPQRLEHGRTRVLVLQGEHDVSTVQILVRELEHACDASAPVVVDLTRVEFLDSSVLNAPTYADQEAAIASISLPTPREHST